MKIIIPIFASFLLFVMVVCSSVEKMTIVSGPRGERIALGEWSADRLLEDFPQYKKNYLSYQPDTLVLDNIKIFSKKVEILTVLGTWCPDSKREVPKFIKLIDKINKNNVQLRFICVDRTKRDKKGVAEALEVELVPTFIVYFDGQEIGRIIESPQISLEEDLLEMFNSIGY